MVLACESQELNGLRRQTHQHVSQYTKDEDSDRRQDEGDIREIRHEERYADHEEIVHDARPLELITMDPLTGLSEHIAKATKGTPGYLHYKVI